MRQSQIFCVWLAIATAASGGEHDSAKALADPNPAVRRAALVALAGSSRISAQQAGEMLNDKDAVTRRTAVRALAGLGEPAMNMLAQAVSNEDPVVRRIAAWALGDMGPAGVPHIERALDDGLPLVRQMAVLALARVRPGSKPILAMLLRAAKDKDTEVRAAAATALANFYTIAQTIRLPADNWAFKLDPNDVGRKEAWYGVGVEDSQWRRIAIEQAWQDAGIEYIGPAWYRRQITLPPKLEMDRAELRFGGVDEGAWVWVNGQYAGEHDIGPRGWNEPFKIDVTSLLRWAQSNQITVRAKNTAAKGGIWRPVELVVLKMQER